jgi:kynurenine formamidase
VQIDIISAHNSRAAETWHLERLSFTAHTGSHVDAPLHRLPKGKSLDDIPLEHWQGSARILDFRGIPARQPITPDLLAERLPRNVPLKDRFLLLATGWGWKRSKTKEWLNDAPFLTKDAAAWLVEKNARGVGIDHWSIGDADTHEMLLSRPVLIVEELRFPAEVFSLQEEYEFWALPINLQAHSGAPCRPVLVLRDKR